MKVLGNNNAYKSDIFKQLGKLMTSVYFVHMAQLKNKIFGKYYKN